MNETILNDKWINVSNSKSKNGFKILRLSSDSVSSLFIGENEDGCRCLLLYPEDKIALNLKDTDKEYISLAYSKAHNLLIIKFKDLQYADVFNQFVISVFHFLEHLNSSEKSVKEFIRLFKKWVEFFKNKGYKRLTIEEIRGLFGELTVIKSLIQEKSDLNEVLDGWKGPFGSHHDFLFSTKDIEVKAISHNNQPIKISSEYQLEASIPLEMWVVQCESNTNEGISLKELILQLTNLIHLKKADISFLLNAILQLGLTIENLSEYDNFRFIAKKIKIYDCSVDTFPKLIRSKIPKDIQDLKYTIVTDNLDSFLLREINLKYDN